MQYVTETLTDQRFTQCIDGALNDLLIFEDEDHGIKCVLMFINETETGGIDYFQIMIHVDYLRDGVHRLIAEVPFKASVYSLGDTPERMAELVLKETAEWLTTHPAEASV